jgi:hypothetical protein
MGGKAFGDRTQRIKKEDIGETLNWLRDQFTNISIAKVINSESLLGSAGQNETSGDLDLNINHKVHDQTDIAEELTRILGEENVRARPSFNQIFSAVPIKGHEENGRIQVDWMFGDPIWQKFSYKGTQVTDANQHYYPPYNTSFVKGLYRTELIKALVAFNSDWVLMENNEMVARVGPTFFHDRGCIWRYRYRPLRQDGEGRVQAFKEVSEEEFMKLYPSAIRACQTSITDPTKLVKWLFDSDYMVPENLDTFEDTTTMISRNFSNQETKTIYTIYMERLNSLKAEIPTKVFQRFGVKAS